MILHIIAFQLQILYRVTVRNKDVLKHTLPQCPYLTEQEWQFLEIFTTAHAEACLQKLKVA